MVQDAKLHRPNSACFLELHKLFGLTWAGQNKTTEEAVRIQWIMYSPACADGYFDWSLGQVFVTNNLLLFLTINNTLLQSGKKEIRIFAGCSLKNISCAIETLQQILEAVVPFYRLGCRGWGTFALSPAVSRCRAIIHLWLYLAPKPINSQLVQAPFSIKCFPVLVLLLILLCSSRLKFLFLTFTMASSLPPHVLPFFSELYAIRKQTWKVWIQTKFHCHPGYVNWGCCLILWVFLIHMEVTAEITYKLQLWVL